MRNFRKHLYHSLQNFNKVAASLMKVFLISSFLTSSITFSQTSNVPKTNLITPPSAFYIAENTKTSGLEFIHIGNDITEKEIEKSIFITEGIEFFINNDSKIVYNFTVKYDKKKSTVADKITKSQAEKSLKKRSQSHQIKDLTKKNVSEIKPYEAPWNCPITKVLDLKFNLHVSTSYQKNTKYNSSTAVFNKTILEVIPYPLPLKKTTIKNSKNTFAFLLVHLFTSRPPPMSI